jgi:ABC-type transporter Mla maintaining outer membrane lipid asymmetry ATPase subunit MlaF
MSETSSHAAVIEMRDAQVAALRNMSVTVLEHVNWLVQAGEFWVVAGLQHSGKSDLLMHAAGLTAPLSGECRVFGCDTREYDESRIADRLRVGFTFAGGKLFDQLTIAENVALPLRYHRELPETETAGLVEGLLELLGIEKFAAATPGNIIPAWRQRAAIARALVLQPELLLLDNPNGGLTARHREWLTDFLDQLWRGHSFFGGRPMTIVVTTDDLQMWRHPRRQFAAVHEGLFCVLGEWGGNEFARNHVVQDLIEGAIESSEPKAPQPEGADNP